MWPSTIGNVKEVPIHASKQNSADSPLQIVSGTLKDSVHASAFTGSPFAEIPSILYSTLDWPSIIKASKSSFQDTKNKINTNGGANFKLFNINLFFKF